MKYKLKEHESSRDAIWSGCFPSVSWLQCLPHLIALIQWAHVPLWPCADVSNASIGLEPKCRKRSGPQPELCQHWVGSHPAGDDCLQSSSRAPGPWLHLSAPSASAFAWCLSLAAPVGVVMLCVLPSCQWRATSCVQRCRSFWLGNSPTVPALFHRLWHLFFLYCCCAIEDLMYPIIDIYKFSLFYFLVMSFYLFFLVDFLKFFWWAVFDLLQVSQHIVRIADLRCEPDQWQTRGGWETAEEIVLLPSQWATSQSAPGQLLLKGPVHSHRTQTWTGTVASQRHLHSFKSVG